MNQDGSVETMVRLSLSKAMMDSISAMSGESEDTDEIFDTEKGPFNPKTNPGLTDLVVEELDNGVDIGLYFKGTLSTIPPGTRPDEAPFIPFEKDNTLTIGLPSLSDEEENPPSDSDEMGAMFFASTKYQLLLDKKLYPDIHSAKVVTKGTDHPASVTELGGNWLIEFPFIIWMQAPKGCLLIIEM